MRPGGSRGLVTARSGAGGAAGGARGCGCPAGLPTACDAAGVAGSGRHGPSLPVPATASRTPANPL